MYKIKGFIIGATILTLVVVSGSMGLACGTPPAPPLQIPANFTTYTDESDLFSISYPADWEVVQPSDETTLGIIKKAKDDLKSGVPGTVTTIIFLARLQTETAYGQSVYIALEPIDDIPRLSRAVAGEVEGLSLVYKNYQEFSRVNTKIGGRAATIIDWSGTGPVKGDQHCLEMITVVDKTTVLVNCTASPEDFAERQNDFNTIINSFRVNTAK
jgi:hypothetical protein